MCVCVCVCMCAFVLMLNVSKTKELMIDFRQKPSYLPDLVIKGEKVERVSQYSGTRL